MNKALILSVFLVIFGLKISAQESHLIIFSEDLLEFHAYVNGIKQNPEAKTNVKVTGLTGQSYQVKVIFKDEDIPAISKNVYFEPMGMANTMKITLAKKGYKLRFFGSVPLNESPQNYEEVVYTTIERPTTMDVEIVDETINENVEVEMDVDMGINMNTNIQVNETVQSDSNSSNENVSMNVSIGGFEMNVDVNVQESHSENIEIEQAEYVIDQDVVQIDDYEEVVTSCQMSETEFDEALISVKEKSFSDSKLTLAKQITKAHCLTADQVKSMMMAFDFEDTKLEYAKYAYEYCCEQNKYYKVNDVFTFESSIEELNEFIEK